MAEPSLLCVNCARPPPAHRRTWNRCKLCARLNLPSTYYCGEECMLAHWPKHQVYHKEQKEREKPTPQRMEHDRLTAEAAARTAERTGDEYDKRCAAAQALGVEGDLHGEAKAWRKIIKQWAHQAEPTPYVNLGVALHRSGRLAEAAEMHLKAMELHEDQGRHGTAHWAKAAAGVFNLLKNDACREAPKPEWWNNEGLKALSARVVALVPDTSLACVMRATVLSRGTGWSQLDDPETRTALELKEAASWWRRAARATREPATTSLEYEARATFLDKHADRLLAKAEAEAKKARATAEVEAAATRKAAEEKADAAAEELLAEEEKEKQQKSTKAGKAKPGKGKKGKGKR